ncbi:MULTISPECIES: hypothetical protein [Paenibacillus]|uniref:hypothetical protein n=1 Tax=Paenibacillus TaxID=44249 RepID=UPI0022B92C6E|nr:hypothetical protein [Paenibacillus caseinilyticus]MCZ8521953.1 hypothetical protein [Paenibacillus caseinilyticus]
MRKLFCGLIAGMSMAASVAYSSDAVENVFSSPIHIMLNDELKALNPAYTILNYKGHLYLPARFMVENMGGAIEYKEAERAVFIYHDDAVEKLSTVNSKKTEGDYELTLHSAESIYENGRMPDIWASLVYKGEQPREITHASPVLVFSIQDEQGFQTGIYRNLSARRSIWNPNSELSARLSLGLIREYHFQKKKGSGREEYENSPLFLQPGNYTIGIDAAFSDSSHSHINLSTELHITIK